MKTEDVINDRVLPQDAPKITDEKWFGEYLQTFLMTLNEDVRENWDHIALMSTAEILQLIEDCGKTATATAINAPFDVEAWRVGAAAMNRVAILAFYVELRYKAIENNLEGMVVQDGTAEHEESDSPSESEIGGVGESDSLRAGESDESTGRAEGSGGRSDGPPEQESRRSEGGTGLTEVPQTGAR